MSEREQEEKVHNLTAGLGRAPVGPRAAIDLHCPVLSAQLKAKYGGLPTQKGLLERRLKGGDKKYFDSADWAQEQGTPEPKPAPAAPPAWTATRDPSSGNDKPTAPPRLGPR
jgi:hypothetical protein